MPKFKYALKVGVSKLVPQKITKFCLLGIIAPLALLNTSSYIISSWMMRPIGDDYDWLRIFTFHQSNWTGAIWHYLMTANGRYAQNAASIIPYSVLGATFLRIAGILVLILLFFVLYQVIKHLSLKFRLRATPTEQILLAFILFFLYTTLSFVYPGTKGHIDNTFQDIIFYPAAVTYTVPLCLLAGLVLLIYKYPTAASTKSRLALIVAAGIVVGLFDESIPLTYCTTLGVVGIYTLLLTRQNVWAFIRRHLGLIAAAVGQVCGVIIIYTSPACQARRLLVSHPDHGSVVVTMKIGLKATWRLIDQYFSSVTIQHSIILVGVIVIVLSVYALSKSKPKLRNVRIYSIHTLVVSGIMYVLSVLASRLVLIIGYGEDQVTPRLEILYNGWLVLFVLAAGLLLASFIINTIRGYLYLPLAVVLAAILVLSIPHSLNQITHRTAVVSAFSAKWDAQNANLLQAAAHKKQHVTVPVIDIGDGYSISCHSRQDGNWLGIAKEQYYNIPHICAKH